MGFGLPILEDRDLFVGKNVVHINMLKRGAGFCCESIPRIQRHFSRRVETLNLGEALGLAAPLQF